MSQVASDGLHVWMPTIRGSSGGDVFVDRLASGLRSCGIQVTVDWFDAKFELSPGRLRRSKPPASANVVHANALSAFAFANHGLPMVVTEHHYVLDPAYRPYTTFLQFLYHRLVIGPSLAKSFHVADILTTHSQFTACVLLNANIRPPARVIPLWADYEVFSPMAGQQIVSNEPLQLFFVGNRSHRKGADVVNRIARLLGPAVEIVCTGGLRGSAPRDAPENVRSLGRLSLVDLVQAYRKCDAALVPSRYEGFGYAALEAMACGKPVVGFSCGSVEEIVDSGRTGFLRQVDDVEGLAEDILTLGADPVLRAQMGEAARARAVSAFSLDSGMTSYVAAYRDAIALKKDQRI